MHPYDHQRTLAHSPGASLRHSILLFFCTQIFPAWNVFEAPSDARYTWWIMPYKKNSSHAASARQLVHASSSRTGQKRPRAEAQTRKVLQTSDSISTLANQPRTAQTADDSSRLKKKRIDGPSKSSQKNVENESDVVEKAMELSDAIHSVQNHCQNLIQLILKNRAILRPKLDLMHEIVLLLRKTSAVKVLTAVSSLPKILFIAAQKGVDEDREPLTATKALVEALLLLAKTHAEELPDFSTKRRRVRSAFVDDAYVDHTEMEIEAAKKAAHWALQLLSKCVRGVSDSVSSNRTQDLSTQLQHADVSELFVLPRDKLDLIIANRLIQHSISSLQNIPSIERPPSKKLPCSQLFDATGSLGLLNPFCSSLLDQFLVNAAKSYTSCVRYSSAKEPLDFITKVGFEVIRSGEHQFQSLAPHSQFILLRHVKNVRLWYRQVSEQALFSREKLLSAKEASDICAPIANLAAHDVAIHWELMDEVRREVSRQAEPFDLLSWKLRPFYRAVFSQAFHVIRSETISSYCNELYRGNLVPLSRRFPTSFRSIVGFMATAEKSFALFDKSPESAMKTAVSLVTYLQRFLRGKSGAHRVCANIHAFLLCVESILEKMSWMCAMWVVQTVSGGLKPDHEWKQVVANMAVVICSIDIFRLPGGQSAETVPTTNRREREIASLLTDTVVNKRVVFSPKPERVRINSLLAFWLTAMIAAKTLDVVEETFKTVDIFEATEIYRSLEITGSWGPSVSGKRCKVVHRILKRLITSRP